MVDVGAKADTRREAVAAGLVRMNPKTLELIRAGGLAEGDVLAVAKIAGILAAKQTPHLTPMCHMLPLTGVELAFELEDAVAEGRIPIQATVRPPGKTGAEMEALTAVSA